MSFIKFHILVFIITLFQCNICKYMIVINDNCKSQIETDDINEFLLETLRGKISLKLENKYLEQFDMNLIQKLNKNINCPYLVIDSNDSYNKTIGIYLGAGINLKNYNYSELENLFKITDFRDRVRYLELIKLVQNSQNLNESILNEYVVPFKDINIFNSVMMNFTINRFKTKINNTQQYNSPFLNSILSVYIQQLITDEEFNNYLNSNNPSDTSYTIEHLFEIFPYTRLLQSKLISLFDANFKYNYNHIFFVIEKCIFEQMELDNINSLIKSLYDKLNNNNRISILVKNENNYTYIINYKKDKDNLDELLIAGNKSEIFFNLTDMYINLNNKFEENKKDYFENRLVILFSNYETEIEENKNELIKKYKNKYGIQTIPIINVANVQNYEKDIFKYNIFNNFSEIINIQYILMAINNMHIPLDLSESDEIKLNNIKINDIDTPLYLEVNTNTEKKELEYYEISLKIEKTSGYNIFISNSNPYPNIRNNLNNFMKYANNNNPKIRIKSSDINNNIFYIGIEGILNFNISINKKVYEGDIQNLILSEGEYDYIEYNTPLDNKNKKIIFGEFTFGNDYTIKSSIFSNITTENMMKYFTRGIDIENTDDHYFLNYNLFTYLYGEYLVNRIYKDSNNNYYFGINMRLKDYTPLKLKKEGFNRFTINKLYKFLNASCDLNNIAPSVIFDDIEIKKILNITILLYTKELTYKIKNYQNCIPFEEQSAQMKFILFCLYFSHHSETFIIRPIINLSLKNPEYLNVISLLNQRSMGNSFLINYIKQIQQETSSEKIMTSIIMGKNLMLSEIGINFINEYYNIMSKSKTKISVSIYDTMKNTIKNIIPFSSTNNMKNAEEIIKSYTDDRDESDTQQMDFNIITKYGYNQFKNYDRGIKKILIVICDENLKDRNYLIDNKIKISKDYTKIDLSLNQVELILITSKNYEKGQIHDLFRIAQEKKDNNYTIYENYFYVPDLRNTEKYMNDLNRLIKGSSIKIKVGQRLINDYYQEKNSYFKIDCSENPNDVIVVKTNISNYIFYASETNPFPYYNYYDLISIKKDAIVINVCKDGIIYFGLEPKSDTRKEIIEIFSCESYQPDNNCKTVADNRIEWFGFFFAVFFFIITFVIYKCRYNLSTKTNKKNKKRLNVFDSIK